MFHYNPEDMIDRSLINTPAVLRLQSSNIKTLFYNVEVAVFLFVLAFSVAVLGFYQMIPIAASLATIAGYLIFLLIRHAFTALLLFLFLLLFVYQQSESLSLQLDKSLKVIEHNSESSLRSRYRKLNVEGAVTEIIDSSIVHGRRIAVELVTPEQGGRIYLTTSDLPWLEVSKLQVGAQFTGHVRVALLAESHASRSSYENYLYRHSVVASGYLERIDQIKSFGESSYVEKVVKDLSSRIEKSEGLAILIAATIGDRSLLNDDLELTFKRFGLVHLLVVSGFHIGVVFLLFRKLFRYLFSISLTLTSFVSADKLAAVFALMQCILYVFLIDAGLSSERALVMLITYTLGLFLGRVASRFNVLFASFVVINLLWPAAISDIGCQLTYAALLGLLTADRLVARFITNDSLSSKVLSTYIFSLFAWLFTAPILYYWFDEVTLLGPVANLLYAHLFSFTIVAAGLIAVILDLAGTVLMLEIVLSVSQLQAGALSAIDRSVEDIDWLLINSETSILAILLFSMILFAPLFLNYFITRPKI